MDADAVTCNIAGLGWMRECRSGPLAEMRMPHLAARAPVPIGNLRSDDARCMCRVFSGLGDVQWHVVLYVLDVGVGEIGVRNVRTPANPCSHSRDRAVPFLSLGLGTDSDATAGCDDAAGLSASYCRV